MELEEAYQRESIFKARTLDMIRGGIDRRDPIFVHTFTSAKRAGQALDRQLHTYSRVEAIEQKTQSLRLRIEAQTAVEEVLHSHRRYLQSDFTDKIDAVDDKIFEKENQLNETILEVDPDPETLERGWLDEADEALLTRWMLAEAPKATDCHMDQYSHLSQDHHRGSGKGGDIATRPIPTLKETISNGVYVNQESLDPVTQPIALTNTSPCPQGGCAHYHTEKGSYVTGLKKNVKTFRLVTEKVKSGQTPPSTDILHERDVSSNIHPDACLVDEAGEPLPHVWLGGLPPLVDDMTGSFEGTPTMDGPIYQIP